MTTPAPLLGVVLAGGRGSRLDPITRLINKHALPVYDAPMLAYPLSLLRDAGVRDITIVTNPKDIDPLRTVLEHAPAPSPRRDLDALRFVAQAEPGGIAHALLAAEANVGGHPLAVVLGDTILGEPITPAVRAFMNANASNAANHTGPDADATPNTTKTLGPHFFLGRAHDPHALGIARFASDLPHPNDANTALDTPSAPTAPLAEIIEKPAHPPSAWAALGIYLYPPDVFDRCRSVTASARSELEITDVNNTYLREGRGTYSVIHSWWADVGTYEGLARAAELVRTRGEHVPR